jgi:AraC-like DNA-binding protein
LHTSFNDFINRLRVEYACKLLNDAGVKDLPLQTIWRRSGFATRSAFYEAFKKHCGKTPSAFRKISDKEETLPVNPINDQSENHNNN